MDLPEKANDTDEPNLHLAADHDAPQEPLAAAEHEIARLKQESEEMRNQWLRAMADAENTRKRAQRDVAEANKYGLASFARDMVSVVENLKRATDSITPAARAEHEILNTLGQGVELTLAEMLAVFDRYQIKRIDPLGEKFDHNFHQAIAQLEDNSKEPGTIVEVVQAGYVLHDRLLRPAMVAVAKKSESEGDASKKVDTTA